MTRVVASVEARMGSSRFPGKVLAEIAGRPCLDRLVERLSAARRLDGIVLATSVDPADDALAAWAEARGLPCFRGSEDDVLGRVVGAHRMMGSDVVVEITGDCPLVDPETVDLGVETFLENDCDVASNTWKLTYPMGADVQVFRLEALEWVAANIDDPPVREHVSLYFYEHPERYRILHMRAPARYRDPDLRLQFDYPEDRDFIEALVSRLEPVHGPLFGVPEILVLLAREPALREINRHCEEKPVR